MHLKDIISTRFKTELYISLFNIDKIYMHFSKTNKWIFLVKN